MKETKKPFTNFTEDDINSLPGKELINILIYDVGEYTRQLREWERDREGNKANMAEENIKFYDDLKRIRDLMRKRLEEELEPFGFDDADPDNLDETGWEREYSCRSIQELLTNCFWYCINPLPALNRHHCNYKWTLLHLPEDENRPARLAEIILFADFIFTANGNATEMGQYIVAVEEPRTRRFRRIISGSLKDDWAIKEARKLLRQKKQKFVQLREGER